MSANPVKWFEIYVQDMNRAKAFYEAVFDTKLVELPNPDMQMYGFDGDPNTYGCPGALVHMDGVPSGGNSVTIYFGCNDCAVEAARAAKSGGSIFKEKFSIGEHGFIALVTDTEGNLIGLHSMV